MQAFKRILNIFNRRDKWEVLIFKAIDYLAAWRNIRKYNKGVCSKIDNGFIDISLV